MKILIADAMSGEAVDILKSKGLSVDVKRDLEKRGACSDHPRYDALIVRSATKVTRDIIAKADKLKVIGRAGIGVDNVDVGAATEKGIVVMNTPQGNALRGCGAHACVDVCGGAESDPCGRYNEAGEMGEKTSSLMGVEVYDKTLGVIGIGNIGMIVAEKAVALGMKVLAYDLFVAKEVASAKGIELVDLDTLLAKSDIITVHLPIVKETRRPD